LDISTKPSYLGYGDIRDTRFVITLGITILLAIPADFWYDKCMSDLDEFMKDPWKKVNEMRKTPHACDYIYSIDPSGTMFFEICKYCFDTNGVVEMNNE
jgi:hypothetical protein